MEIGVNWIFAKINTLLIFILVLKNLILNSIRSLIFYIKKTKLYYLVYLIIYILDSNLIFNSGLILSSIPINIEVYGRGMNELLISSDNQIVLPAMRSPSNEVILQLQIKNFDINQVHNTLSSFNSRDIVDVYNPQVPKGNGWLYTDHPLNWDRKLNARALNELNLNQQLKFTSCLMHKLNHLPLNPDGTASIKQKYLV
jgi:hypothetical protein